MNEEQKVFVQKYQDKFTKVMGELKRSLSELNRYMDEIERLKTKVDGYKGELSGVFSTPKANADQLKAVPKTEQGQQPPQAAGQPSVASTATASSGQSQANNAKTPDSEKSERTFQSIDEILG